MTQAQCLQMMWHFRKKKRTELSKVLEQIGLCGNFTSLKLNISKTVVFDPHGFLTDSGLGVQIKSEPIKYLGAFLGTDPLVESKNFDLIKTKMKTKIDRWKHRVTSLQG